MLRPQAAQLRIKLPPNAKLILNVPVRAQDSLIKQAKFHGVFPSDRAAPVLLDYLSRGKLLDLGISTLF